MDHNFTQAVEGNPQIFSQLGDFSSKEYKIRGVASFHDHSEGHERGGNIIYRLETEGLVVCHMGDLGHVLNAKEIQELGEIDVLMIPVGGYYTIDAIEAAQVVNQLNPKIVLPMHFKPENSDIIYNISGVEPFCRSLGWEVINGLETLEVNSSNLESWKRKIVLFNVAYH
jgi:L-ascorbate metabolism protein UlaG (beta-lactamase superfamily)